MISRELLYDMNVYSGMSAVKQLSMLETNAVTFTGDMHGLAIHKLDMDDNRLHPLLVAVNGYSSANEYDDAISIVIPIAIGNRHVNDFVEFLNANY